MLGANELNVFLEKISKILGFKIFFKGVLKLIKFLLLAGGIFEISLLSMMIHSFCYVHILLKKN